MHGLNGIGCVDNASNIFRMFEVLTESLPIILPRCDDNVVAERFSGSLKVEQVLGAQYPWRSATKQEIIEYIKMFYNSRLRHSSLGYINPMEFEKKQLWKKAA